jgi:hypothetical protein
LKRKRHSDQATTDNTDAATAIRAASGYEPTAATGSSRGT